MMVKYKCSFQGFFGTNWDKVPGIDTLMLIERMLGIVPHLTRQMQERMPAASTVAVR
jgi:hypothetical protein